MFEDIYVRISAIYKKIKYAQDNHRHLYISAPIGYGKTAALQYFFKSKAVCWLSGEKGYIENCPDSRTIRQSIVIIDNITWLTDESSKNYVIQLLDEGDKLVIMSG